MNSNQMSENVLFSSSGNGEFMFLTLLSHLTWLNELVSNYFSTL